MKISGSAPAPQSIQNFFQPTTSTSSDGNVKCQFDKKDFKKGIVEMVVYNGVAVRFFESVGFQRINGEVARKLGVGLNRDSIRKLVIERAEEMKEEMIG